MKSIEKKSFEILRNHLLKKQRANPQYSIRALARDIDVSSSYLTAVFSGKKPVPNRRLNAIAKRLEIDEISLMILKKIIALEKVTAETQRLIGAGSMAETKSIEFLEKFKEEDHLQIELWSKWYNVALLDLATCKSFRGDPIWISKRLGIHPNEASVALDFLLRKKYLIQTQSTFKKADLLLRLPQKKSRQTIRDFHKQLMVRAIETMNQETSEEAFEKRLISGITVATNFERIAEAKKRINFFLHELADFLSDGDGDEVYQLGLQFFPLTK